MRSFRQPPWSIACALVVAVAFGAVGAAPASASHNQDAMFQDTVRILAQPAAAFSKLRLLGVTRVRMFVTWERIAPRSGSHRRPHHFIASDPKSYPKSTWASWDEVVKAAQAAQIGLNLDLGGGAPLWATGPGAPAAGGPHQSWEPSPSEYKAFVHAFAVRYSGKYKPAGASKPLPRVSFWSIWNEPDYGPSLAPQGVLGNLKVENSPHLYRDLLDAGWQALESTGHAHDTILIGELAPRGKETWGRFDGIKPLRFVRALYCVDSQYRQLRGTAAALRGCPTTAAGSSRFRARHPGLFRASGFAVHPYSRWHPPNVETPFDPEYASLAELPTFERGLDRLQRVYGSSTRFPIWNTEYGYVTSPPKINPDPHTGLPNVSASTAAYYMNWAEYISWRDPRIQSTMQYLIGDPLPRLRSNDYGGFASGLLNFKGRPKPAYYAYRLPLFLPVTKAGRNQPLEVWGSVRPAHFALIDMPLEPEVALVQFEPASGGPFTTLKMVTITDPHGYFDTHVAFPSSGTVRLTWTYPADDPLLAPGYTAFSRHVQISLH